MSPMKRILGSIAAFALAFILHGTHPIQAAEPEATASGKVVKSNLPPLPADWKEPLAREPVVPLSQRYLVKPILDVPLRAPSICKGPDGTYYLTGTCAVTQTDGTPDFNNCTTIRLWKSADLKEWTDMGKVFDPTQVGWTPDKGHIAWSFKTVKGLPGVADSLRHYRGVHSPEIHYLKSTFWMAFSMHGESTVLIKSTSGKAEGPYELMGMKGARDYYITSVGSDPSIFQDDDGSVYWLWSPGWIAKMNDDMTGLAEPPRLLTCEPLLPLKGDVMVGRRGPFLWKAKGLYHLAVSDTINRLGIHVEDTLVATSKTLFGPYSKRIFMIPHGGQTTVFQDGNATYHATFCGNDRFAAFRDKAGIVPLEWMNGYRNSFYKPEGVLVANPRKVYTERGPWHKMLPCFDRPGFYLRDHHVMQAPDGYFYASGSAYGDPYVGKLPIWRSRDLKEWEEIIVRTFDDEKHWPEAKRKHRALLNGQPSVFNWNQYYMSTAINWVPKLNTFVISYDAWNDCPPNDPHKSMRANGYLISTTGKGEGPYEVMPKGTPNNCSKFFEDDDGQFYHTEGCNALSRLNDDFSKQKKLPDVYPAAGGETSEDCACTIVKMHGKYVFLTITCGGNNCAFQPGHPAEYGWSYMTADSPKGPWSKLMPGPRHCAWGTPFRGLDGHWYASTMADDYLGSFHCKVAIVRLKTELKDGQLLIDIDDDWTHADYKPITEWKGEGSFSPYTDTTKGPAAKK